MQRLIREQRCIAATSDDGLFQLQWCTEKQGPKTGAVIDLASDDPVNRDDDPLVKLIRRAFEMEDSVGFIVSAIMDDDKDDGPTFLAWRQMVVKDITERKQIGCPYKLTSPDGLCGYRAAYQIYLFSMGREPRDVNLMNPGEAAEFLKWLKEGAARPAGDILKEALGHVIKWVEDSYIKSQKGGFFSGVEAHGFDTFGWCNGEYMNHLLPGIEWQLLMDGSKGLCQLGQNKRSSRGVYHTFANLLESARAFHYVYFGDAHFWFPKPQRPKTEAPERTIDDRDRVMSALRNAADALVKEIGKCLKEEDAKAASLAQLRKEIVESQLTEEETPEIKQRLLSAVEKELGEGRAQWVLGMGRDPSQEEMRASCALFKVKRKILCLLCRDAFSVRSAKSHSRGHPEAQLEALKQTRQRNQSADGVLAALGHQRESGAEPAAGGGAGGGSTEESKLASSKHSFPPSIGPEPSSGGTGAE